MNYTTCTMSLLGIDKSIKVRNYWSLSNKTGCLHNLFNVR